MATQGKLQEEGYADVSYEDTWCLDMTLARIIANHLRAFLKAEKGPWGGCPGIFYEKYGSEKCHDVWLNTIRKMIYAFEEYQRNDKYDIDEEKRKRIREGMQLFIDYYRNLWVWKIKRMKPICHAPTSSFRDYFNIVVV